MNEPIPWAKGKWHGTVTEYNGTPHGLFNLRIRNGARSIFAEKLDEHQVRKFDPEQWWANGRAENTKNSRMLRENRRGQTN